MSTAHLAKYINGIINTNNIANLSFLIRAKPIKSNKNQSI